VLLHDSQSNYVVSGGADGVLRLWDAARLADAEPGEGGAACQVRPAAEVVLPGGGCPRGLLWQGRSSWLVLSDAGALLRVALPLNLLDSEGFVPSRLLELHAGGVLGAYTCPDMHVVITAAVSGAIHAINYRWVLGHCSRGPGCGEMQNTQTNSQQQEHLSNCPWPLQTTQ
jgi:hypothetical protein